MAAIKTSTRGRVLVVEFLDRKILDSQRIQQVGEELQQTVSQAIHKKLLLSFQDVSFMSSAMITKLVMLRKSCKAQGVKLKLCHVGPNVMEVFKITKLDFDIDDGAQPFGSLVPNPANPPSDSTSVKRPYPVDDDEETDDSIAGQR